MAAILIGDFDTRLFDSIVENEYTDYYTRVRHALDTIIDAFCIIADEDVNVKRSDKYDELEEIAIIAAEDWTDYFNSPTDRRAILFRMFQKVTPIIKSIPPTKQEFIYNSGSIEEISQDDLDRLRKSLQDFYNRNYNNFAANKQIFQKHFNIYKNTP